MSLEETPTDEAEKTSYNPAFLLQFVEENNRGINEIVMMGHLHEIQKLVRSNEQIEASSYIQNNIAEGVVSACWFNQNETGKNNKGFWYKDDKGKHMFDSDGFYYLFPKVEI